MLAEAHVSDEADQDFLAGEVVLIRGMLKRFNQLLE
jgi:hypothetical protein